MEIEVNAENIVDVENQVVALQQSLQALITELRSDPTARNLCSDYLGTLSLNLGVLRSMIDRIEKFI